MTLSRTCSGRLWLTQPQSQQCADIGDILQALQQRDEMQQAVVCRVIDPALDGDGIVWCRSSALASRHVRATSALPSWKT